MSTTTEISYDVFIAMYPEFSSLPQTTFDYLVVEANIILSKYCIKDDAVLTVIIYKCIAHLYQLKINTSVGRVSAGTQGSTNVTLEYSQAGSAGAWWNQTPYGAYIYNNIIKPRSLGGRLVI